VPVWRWKTRGGAGELPAAPPAVGWEEAQEWCNFVLWRPVAVPEDCVVGTGTLRQEAPPGRTGHTAGRTPWSPANAAAHRCEVTGRGRRLRIKQFLYDWAFPAADHPCLWTSDVRPFALDGERVVWLGTDYLGNPAAGARLARTTVELSVLEGEFTDQELVGVFAGMRPVAADAVERVLATPFSELSYWARYPVDMVPVPTGVFVFHRAGRAHEGEWVAPAAVPDFLAGLGVPRAVRGYRADSAAVFADGEGRRELEVIYTSPVGGGGELRLVAQAAGRGRLEFPPRRDKHPARTRVVEQGGLTVHLGYVDARFGACDAQWADPGAGLELKLLGSAGAALGREAFLAHLADLVAGLRLRGDAEVLR
jgi:hypothetical protein